MEGEIIGTVLESRHPGFSVGERVAGRLGWQTHAISDGTGLVKLDDRFKPITTAVGVLGMPGLTAYSGLLTLGKPQPGETVVVAAARSEEHTSELQSLMRISYAVFCLQKKKHNNK